MYVLLTYLIIFLLKINFPRFFGVECRSHPYGFCFCGKCFFYVSLNTKLKAFQATVLKFKLYWCKVTNVEGKLHLNS